MIPWPASVLWNEVYVFMCLKEGHSCTSLVEPGGTEAKACGAHSGTIQKRGRLVITPLELLAWTIGTKQSLLFPLISVSPSFLPPPLSSSLTCARASFPRSGRGHPSLPSWGCHRISSCFARPLRHEVFCRLTNRML